ncbi:MAG: PP2C family protein-serine/threonine phosphatase [Actinomycetes bacterium]
MVDDGIEDEQRQALNFLLPLLELPLQEVWTRYFAMGGDSGLLEVEAFLHDLVPLPDLQRDVLAQTVNERLDELAWPGRVPLSRTVRDTRPSDGPLAALVELLDGAHLAAPERLGDVAERAASCLGLGLVTYLVDYEQQHLHPLPSPAARGRTSLSVDGTLAGRAFQTVRAQESENVDGARLWVPLVDGVERLGVLEVSVPRATDLHDPGLHTQCRWLSRMIGHLLTSMSAYGDALDALRRTRQRDLATELLTSLLPPRTTGVDGFVLSASLQPSYQAAGDAFDYALTAEGASLAVFDAMGHDVNAGIVAAASVAAYRRARRAGGGVYAQARAVDELLATTFPDAFCTGVLAELDLPSGRLRYLSAGHPSPLLYRRGKVVRSLDLGRRVPFGLDDPEVTVGEEYLQPGDWLMLYTDGVTEARDGAGQLFGEARLADFLAREASTGYPPPETVRRLMQAVLAHQQGVLQDDATVLLASWRHEQPGVWRDEPRDEDVLL